MLMTWKDRTALTVLLLFVLGAATIVVEHELNPEEPCSGCFPTSHPPARFDFFGERMSTNRICPRCEMKLVVE